MKNFKINRFIALLFTLVIIFSCVKDDEYDVPNTDPIAPEIEGTIITIDSLLNLLLQEQNGDPNEFLSFNESDLYISGFVISNDEAGNFFEELIIQDLPENPIRGVRLLIDVNPLFTSFEFGRKVFVKLDGLTVGFSNDGILTLGAFESGSVINKISESLMPETVIRDVIIAEIIPLEMIISEFEIDKTNLFIQLNDAQFNRNEATGIYRRTFAGEPDDEFDGERTLESCNTKSSTILSTSTFSDFKAILLPQGRGTIHGILTRDYYNENFNIVLNTPETIYFDNEDRCDPEFFICTTESGGGDVFYNEKFESFNTMEEFVEAGWTNTNINEGETLWEIGSFSNSNYAQITGYSSGEEDIEVWLITPTINMGNTTNEELLIDIQSSYDNGTILNVLFSSNFTGDLATATWELLDVAIPVGPLEGFGDFETVGPINISCIEGTINIAFLYEGSDPNATTRYHIDTIKITGY